MDWKTASFIISVPLLALFALSSTTDTANFIIAPGDPYMVPLKEPLIVKSRLHCASLCGQEEQGQCFSYAYDDSQKSCTLGLWITYLPYKSSPAGSVVYTSACCASSGIPAISFKEMGTSSLCLLMNNEGQKDYDYATKFCERKDARLLTAKTRERLDYFWTLAGTKDYYWLGLDDIKEEGHYVWSDGSNLEYEWTKMAGNEYEFNQNNDDEDCAHIYKYTGGSARFINDGECYKKYYWACEMKAPMSQDKLKEMCPELDT